MMKSLLALLFVGSVLALGGCSSEDKTEKCTYNERDIPCDQMPGRATAEKEYKENVSFTCGTKSCESKEQYCLQSVRSNFEVLNSSCQAKPANCDKCECLQKDAKALWQSECRGWVSCSSSNSIVTVQCAVPGY